MPLARVYHLVTRFLRHYCASDFVLGAVLVWGEGAVSPANSSRRLLDLILQEDAVNIRY